MCALALVQEDLINRRRLKERVAPLGVNLREGLAVLQQNKMIAVVITEDRTMSYRLVSDVDPYVNTILRSMQSSYEGT